MKRISSVKPKITSHIKTGYFSLYFAHDNAVSLLFHIYFNMWGPLLPTTPLYIAADNYLKNIKTHLHCIA